MKSPAYQFYPKDYLGSARVAELTLEEEGAYNRALCYCWLNNGLPSDPERLARVIGKGCSIAIATLIASLFICHPSDKTKLIHERLEAEKKKQESYHKNQQKAGKKGAKKRWGSADKQQDNSTAIDSPLAKNSSPISNLHISSPISNLQSPTENIESEPQITKISNTAERLEEKIEPKTEGFKKEKNSAKKEKPIDVRWPWLEPEFVELWHHYEQHRLEHPKGGKPYASRGLQGALSELSNMAQGNMEVAMDILRYTMFKNWLGFEYVTGEDLQRFRQHKNGINGKLNGTHYDINKARAAAIAVAGDNS